MAIETWTPIQILGTLSPEAILKIQQVRDEKGEVIDKLAEVINWVKEELEDPKNPTDVEAKVVHILEDTLFKQKEELDKWMRSPIRIEKVFGCGHGYEWIRAKIEK